MLPAPSETLNASVLNDIIAVQQQVATAELSPLAIMELITQSAARLTAADGAILNIPEGDSYIVCSAVGCSQSLLSARFSREHNLTAVADDSHQILLCSDVSADPRADQRLRRQFSAGSIIIVPLLHAG